MTKYSHQNAVDLFVRMVQVDSPSFSESAMVDFIENEVKHWVGTARFCANA